MSGGTRLRATAGGSVTLVANDAKTVDEVVIVSSTEVQVMSPDSSVWAIRVDNAGAITATKV